MKVATAAQTRLLEQRAVDAGASWAGLMAAAGAGIARIALDVLGDGRPRRVLILVGPGNNGGDGLVVASRLHDAGLDVTLYIWKRKPAPADWPRAEARARGIPEVDAGLDGDRADLARLLVASDLVVDALLGMGLTRPADDELCGIVEHVNRSGGRVLAVDVPTGLQSDTGAVMGCAIEATHTAVAGILKPGILFEPRYVGSWSVVPIGLPETLENESMAEKMTAPELRALLPARPADSHKGTFGKVMVVAGSGRYPGAAFLAASGALRSGAGLVTLAVGRSIFGALAASLHETTFLPLPEEEWGTLGGAAATELLDSLAGYKVVVLGPGLGSEEPTGTFLSRLLKLETSKAATGVGFVRAAAVAATRERKAGGVGFVRTAAKEDDKPPPAAAEAAEPGPSTFVVDADGLNLLAKVDGWTDHLAAGSLVLTPHPGEMARLLGLSGPAEINADRLESARQAAMTWKQVVVLKGPRTVVADADGRASIGPAGNPALATAGTGDVLSGIIGGLIAQGAAPFDAARLGVYLHAMAGKLVRDELGEAGGVAGDLLERVPRSITALRQSSQ